MKLQLIALVCSFVAVATVSGGASSALAVTDDIIDENFNEEKDRELYGWGKPPTKRPTKRPTRRVSS
jgi:hypothetical protein